MRKNKILVVALIGILLWVGLVLMGCDSGRTPENDHIHSYGSWQSNSTNHWKECSCGEEYGRGSHSGNPNCTVCDYYIGSGTHAHSYGSWQSNSTSHWRVCNSCGEESDRGNHSGNPNCTVCGYYTGGGGTSVPGIPTGVTATQLSSTSVSISWNVVSGATSYKVYYGTAGTTNPVLTWTTTSLSYTDTRSYLSTGQTYYYKVSAVNSAGEGSASSVVSVTLSSSGGTSLPSAPTNVTATALSSSNISVSWSSVTGATSYKVYYKNYSSAGSSDTSGLSLYNTTSSTSITVTGLLSSTFYVFYVKASNSVGDSAYNSVFAYAQTNSSGSGTSVPSAPTGVTASRNPTGSTTVRVSWNTVNGATSYRIYYSTTGSGSGNLDGTSTTTSYTSEGNSTTSTWYFRVSAVNNAGEGSPSSWVSVGSVSGGSSCSLTIVNNTTRTIQNFLIYQQGYNLLTLSGIYPFYVTISPGSSQTTTSLPAGTYVEIGSETYLGYKVRKTTTFTLIAGQTTTVTINAADLIAN